MTHDLFNRIWLVIVPQYEDADAGETTSSDIEQTKCDSVPDCSSGSATAVAD